MRALGNTHLHKTAAERGGEEDEVSKKANGRKSGRDNLLRVI